ncbi:MAG: GxxExxY protein [Polyangiaceae bacterium]|nr:GxxExxY protein [Polyangiaceae bacterium]MBK8255014.1 GxxExxY protein [Polyangiaceae bacterium]MBK8255029.1 GxxExxY protein [Polyangiaceae bacterium]
MLLYKELSQEVVGAALEVHRHLGPGLLESAYDHALCHELGLRRLHYRRQVEVPVHYKGVVLGSWLRMDLLVEERIVVEVKAVEQSLPIHGAQLLTYLRLSGYRVGLLINFNSLHLKSGIVRRVI